MNFEELKITLENFFQDPAKSIDSMLHDVCKILQSNVAHYDWVGFYFANHADKTLHLKAFAGEPTEHTIIPFGKGICGQVAVSNQNFVVPNVQEQDNYISCNMHVKSEIVIPLFKHGKNIGQIDIDSNTLNAFGGEDERFLEWVNQNISQILER